MDPLWTEPVKLARRKVDPLGLARISDWATENLLPGITTVTTVARNYVYYCWIIKDLGLAKPTTRPDPDIVNQFVKRESALVLASLLHGKGHQEGRNPLGTDRARRVLDKADSRKTIQTDFSPSESNRWGFYGLYYRSAMRRLGLTVERPVIDKLTQAGEELANSFDTGIRHTPYYRLRNTEAQRLPTLTKLAESTCICMLRKSARERDLLGRIMFGPNLPSSNLQYSRRSSLRMILSMVEACSLEGVNLYDEQGIFRDLHFRDLIFYSQFAKRNKIIDYDHTPYKDAWTRWRLYQIHEFFGYATESLLTVFVEILRQRGDMTLDEFLAYFPSLKGDISRVLHVTNPCNTWNELLDATLYNFGARESSTRNLTRFNTRCSLKSTLNEHNLCVEIDRNLEQNKQPEVAAYAFALIALCCLRCLPELDKMADANIWFRTRSMHDFGVFSFVLETRHRWSRAVVDYAKEVFQQILQQHDLIAFEKMGVGNDTFRFESKGNRYFFKSDVEPNFRNSRLYAVVSILGDLGFVEEKKGVLTVTKEGARFAKEK